MSQGRSPIAELHVHLGGCLDYRGCLALLLTLDDPHWGHYEASYHSAFGVPSPARAIVDAVRRGDVGAEAAFRTIFEFRDADGGRFARFQAKFDLINVAFGLTESGWSNWNEAQTIAAFLALEAQIQTVQQSQGLDLVETRVFLRGAPVERARAVLSALLGACATPRGGPRRQMVLSLDRADPWPHWTMVEELALSPQGPHLIGVDFCNVEEGHPPKQKSAFFRRLRQFNAEHPTRALALLYHVGESFNDKSIESAIRWVVEIAEAGAHRLGHAIALGIDPDHFGCHQRTESVAERLDQIEYELAHSDALMRCGARVDPSALVSERARLRACATDDLVDVVYDEARLETVRAHQRFAAERVRATGAVIEVCPSSNRRIAGLRVDALHPIHRFVEWDLPFVIASDDPGLFGVDLSSELTYASTMVGADRLPVETLRERTWRARSEVLVGRVQPPISRR